MWGISRKHAAAMRYGIEQARAGEWIAHPGLKGADAMLALEAYLRSARNLRAS